MNHFFKGLLYHWMAQLNKQRTLMMLICMPLSLVILIKLPTYFLHNQSVSNTKVNGTKSCGLNMNGWDVGIYLLYLHTSYGGLGLVHI